MAKAILKTLEGIGDQLKGEYEKIVEGHPFFAKHPNEFALKVDAVDGIAMEDVQGLKNTVSATRAERDTWMAKAKAFGDDADPVAVKKALKDVEEMKNWSPDKKVAEQIESAKSQLATKHGEEKRALQARIDSMESELSGLLIDAEAIQAISEMGASKSAKLLMPFIKQHCRVVRGDDGKATAVVMQEDGKNPRLSAKANSTENMRVREFVESLKAKDDFAFAFPASGAAGAGTQRGGSKAAGNGGVNNSQRGGQPGGNNGGKGDGTSLSMVDQLKELRRSQHAANGAGNTAGA